MKKIPLIIDADTGIDDAVAIAVALYIKKFDVRLISSVFGNSSVESTTANNLNLISILNKPFVKVAQCRGVNLSKASLGVSAHGKSGLGNYEFPAHNLKELEIDAVEAMHNELVSSTEPVTILATGPLSNIAELLRSYPEDKGKIKELVISGGLVEDLKEGEKPYLSFNVATDTVSAREVLGSGIKISVVPSNLGHDAYLDWKEVYKTKNMNKTGAIFEEIFRSYNDRHVKNGIATHDLCALLFISDPVNFEKRLAKVTIKDVDGMGVLQFDFDSNEKDTFVAVRCNTKKIKQLFFRALKKMPK